MTGRILLAAVATLALAGCATTDPEPQIRTVYVDRPVPVSCIPANARIEPDFRVARSDIPAAADAAERTRLLGVGFLERDAYIGETLPLLRGCRAAPTLPTEGQ